MNLLVNENVTGTVIDELRQRGHDVLSVKESMRSEDDAVILARAQAEQRIVVTHDKDFVELAFRAQLPATSGIILFRLSGSDPDADNQRMLEAIESRKGIERHRLRELILRDLAIYQSVSIGELQQRIGREIPRRRIQRLLTELSEAGEIQPEGSGAGGDTELCHKGANNPPLARFDGSFQPRCSTT